MAGRPRINSNDVLREVRDLRNDIAQLTMLLIGSPDDSDKPGLVERVRSLEANNRTVKWLSMLVAAVLISDIVTRFAAWYKGAP
jgi:peptidoglycan hydrolase CwlO-like protein